MKRTPLRRKTPMRPKPRARKVQKRNAELEATRLVLQERSGGFCEIAAKGCLVYGAEVHHRRLRSQGGDHSPANTLLACRNCHAHAHAHPRESYAKGWLIRGVR